MAKIIKYVFIVSLVSFMTVNAQDTTKIDSTKLNELFIKYQDATKYLQWLRQQELLTKGIIFDIDEAYRTEIQLINEKKKNQK
jgi:hypothetical protein